MAGPTPFTARALADAQDRLLSADEPLAGFHRRCGGELPGPIVTPALLELVRKSRAYQLRLARAIRAQDDRELVSMWVEIEPAADGASAIAISNWQGEPLRERPANAEAEHRYAISRHLAEITARLGTRRVEERLLRRFNPAMVETAR